MLPILTGRHIFGCSLAERMAEVRQKVKDLYGMDLAEILPEPRDPRILGVFANVNHNRWIVECPDCHSAEYLWPDEPWFMCTNCFNGTVRGAWRKVHLPAWRGTIERILCARPIPANRNWTPGETVAFLRAENKAHGLPEEAA